MTATHDVQISWPEFNAQEAFATMLDGVIEQSLDWIATAVFLIDDVARTERDRDLARWADDGGR